MITANISAIVWPLVACGHPVGSLHVTILTVDGLVSRTIPAQLQNHTGDNMHVRVCSLAASGCPA